MSLSIHTQPIADRTPEQDGDNVSLRRVIVKVDGAAVCTTRFRLDIHPERTIRARHELRQAVGALDVWVVADVKGQFPGVICRTGLVRLRVTNNTGHGRDTEITTEAGHRLGGWTHLTITADWNPSPESRPTASVQAILLYRPPDRADFDDPLMFEANWRNFCQARDADRDRLGLQTVTLGRRTYLQETE